MPIWYIETKEDDTATDTFFGDPEIGYATEPYRANGYYEAETRSKAKAKFFKEFDLEFIEPVNVVRVVECEVCGNEGGWWKEVWIECPECGGRSYREDVK